MTFAAYVVPFKVPVLSIETLLADPVVLVAAVESTGVVVTVVIKCRMDLAVCYPDTILMVDSGAERIYRIAARSFGFDFGH